MSDNTILVSFMAGNRDRFFVMPPVEGGYAWWDVSDRDDPTMPNRHVATFFKDDPDAERKCHLIADFLNAFGLEAVNLKAFHERHPEQLEADREAQR